MLEAGTRRIHLTGLRGTLAGGRFAVDEVRWQEGRLSSRGEFSALPAAPLLAFTGAAPRVSSTLTLAGRWSFAAAPRITGNLVGLARRRRPGAGRRARTGARPHARRARGGIRRRPRARDARCALAPGRRRPERRSRTGATGRRRASAPARRSRLSARVNATSLRALQGIAGTTAIIDGRLKLDLAGHGTLDSVRFSGTVEGDAAQGSKRRNTASR